MILNKKLISEVVYSCFTLLSQKRFEKNISISAVDIDRILQENISKNNLELSPEENYENYLAIIEELQEYIQD